MQRTVEGWCYGDARSVAKNKADDIGWTLFRTRRDLLERYPLLKRRDCHKYRITITVEEA